MHSTALPPLALINRYLLAINGSLLGVLAEVLWGDQVVLGSDWMSSPARPPRFGGIPGDRDRGYVFARYALGPL